MPTPMRRAGCHSNLPDTSPTPTLSHNEIRKDEQQATHSALWHIGHPSGTKSPRRDNAVPPEPPQKPPPRPSEFHKV